eukprot:SAG25_NODE_1218_length_3582_cov_13.521102_2_plen_74_part_00
MTKMLAQLTTLRRFGVDFGVRRGKALALYEAKRREKVARRAGTWVPPRQPLATGAWLCDRLIFGNNMRPVAPA